MISLRHDIGKIVLILLALVFITLLGIALIGCHVTGRSFDECFFGTCCGSLYVLGLALGFTIQRNMCNREYLFRSWAMCVIRIVGGMDLH